jgi:hypothetical protein
MREYNPVKITKPLLFHEVTLNKGSMMLSEVLDELAQKVRDVADELEDLSIAIYDSSHDSDGRRIDGLSDKQLSLLDAFDFNNREFALFGSLSEFAKWAQMFHYELDVPEQEAYIKFEMQKLKNNKLAN